jgi:HlyD family secretion protein
MGPTFRRVVIWGALTALLVAGLIHAFMPQPVPVDMGVIDRGALQVTVDDEGRTKVKDVYVVSSPLAGRALRIEIEAGDPVVAGETVVASIYPNDPEFLDVRSQSEAEADVKAAEAALTLANAELQRAMAERAFALDDLERARALATKKHISQRALDAAILEVRTHEAVVASAQAALQVRDYELERARAALIVPGQTGQMGPGAESCCIEVHAPVDGVVLQVLHESEGVVAAGAPLLELGDPLDLEVVTELLSSDAVRVELGADVLIEDWGGGVALAGRVWKVEPFGFTKVSALGIEEQRVKVIVDFMDPPAARGALGHGYRVETRIIIWQGSDILRVPVSALFRDGGDWAVFLVANGIAILQPIVIGHVNSYHAEVLDGLASGDSVILHPSDRVAPGVEVVARDQP